jgi:hypothetical protein
MRIEHYSFGNITIDGQTYTSDLIIYPDRIDTSWWRKEGHNLQLEDLKDVLNVKPEVLIIGTGAFGVMRVPKEIIVHLESKGIKVHAMRTGKAVDLFNQLRKDAAVTAVLHLTC